MITTASGFRSFRMENLFFVLETEMKFQNDIKVALKLDHMHSLLIKIRFNYIVNKSPL